MRPLSEINPYLRDPEARRRLLEQNVRESSIFEGARGLPFGKPQKPSRKRPSKAAKKADSDS